MVFIDEFVLAGGGGLSDPTALAFFPAPLVPLLALEADFLSWTPVTDATAYDVVRGDLATLSSSGGDFTLGAAIVDEEIAAARGSEGIDDKNRTRAARVRTRSADG